jgi:hypothetical protein
VVDTQCIDTHRIKPSDVANLPKFAETWQDSTNQVEVIRKKYNCDEVCLVGWNLKATDAYWLFAMEEILGAKTPTSFKWLWDAFRTVSMTKSCPFYVDIRANPKQASQKGNLNHHLPSLYRAVTGTPMQGYHNSGMDAMATYKIVLDDSIWKLQSHGLAKFCGLFPLSLELDGRRL